MTAMLLALNGRLRLRNRHNNMTRELELQDFFIGYKKTAAGDEERIDAILIPEAGKPRTLVFEKAAKRARLDIAAVNTALACRVEKSGDKTIIRNVRISAGGVGPTPLFLAKASSFAEGKMVDATLVREVARLASDGTAPISDARGSAAYRKTMVERLVMAHFLRLFPELKLEEELFA